ncbi:MAG: hypothetical protein L0216_12515 [Planctomycetales bacterium]|nr:hypothetical protein [Planctomycetales bacterium]
MAEAPLPLVFPLRQRLATSPLADPAGAVRAGLGPWLAGRVAPGARVAITAGSRGVANYPVLLRAACEANATAGGRPLLVPAMGSHGGGTPEGRRALLARLGVTPESVGAPIEDGEPVPIGETPDRIPVFAARPAAEAAGIVVLNRVKPHSLLEDPLGSGLRKMLGLGLGGPAGAEALHGRGIESVVVTARVAREKLRVLAGVAIVEDGAGETAIVEAVPPERFDEADERLLAEARRFLPGLPFDRLDALALRRIGKDVSGVGMDPNVIGRYRRLGIPPRMEDVVRIGRIAVCGLTEATGGNALGVGMADVATARVRDRMDAAATAVNARTAGFAGGDRLREVVATDRDAVVFACRGKPSDRVRLLIARDTAHLERLLASSALLPEARALARLEVLGPPGPIPFDAGGSLEEP